MKYSKNFWNNFKKWQKIFDKVKEKRSGKFEISDSYQKVLSHNWPILINQNVSKIYRDFEFNFEEIFWKVFRKCC